MSKKLYPRYNGPYYITHKGPNHSYKLRNCRTNKLLKFPVHANRLKLYKDPRDHRHQNPSPLDEKGNTQQTTDSVRNSQEPFLRVEPEQNSIPFNISDNTSQSQTPATQSAPQANIDVWYAVDRLLKSKWIKGKNHYLVRWTDKTARPTWEPQESITPLLVEQFHINKSKTQKRKKGQ